MKVEQSQDPTELSVGAVHQESSSKESSSVATVDTPVGKTETTPLPAIRSAAGSEQEKLPILGSNQSTVTQTVPPARKPANHPVATGALSSTESNPATLARNVTTTTPAAATVSPVPIKSPKKKTATTTMPQPPVVTLYNPKTGSKHCTIHHPTLSQLQAYSFADYIRTWVLPAASVRYDNDDNNNNVTIFERLAEPMELREGIAKIVLPAGFQKNPVEATGRTEEWQAGHALGDFVLQSPIQQNLLGIAGVYEYTFTDQKPISMAQFREKADKYRKEQVGCSIEEELSPDRLDALERLFWKGLRPTMEPAWYGADQSGSLFDENDNATGWSLSQLDSCLHVLSDIPGVTSSYLYAGMWASVFCAHTEDMNLLSINYMHAGQPKMWYAVAEPDAARFLSVAQFQFARQAAGCCEFLRHKRCLLSPAVLKKAGIRYQTAIQYPGEAIVTFPGSYHFGFNLGFNVAEATNFGVPEWLPFGEQARVCLCRPHSVRIDVARLRYLLERYERDQKSLRRGNRLSWKEWGNKLMEKKRKVEAEEETSEAEEGEQAATSKQEKKSKRRKVKMSEQERRREFYVEVMKPLTSTFGVRKERKGTKNKRNCKTKEEENWHLAKPILLKQGLSVNARILCMVPGTTMWTLYQHTSSAGEPDNSSLDEDKEMEEEEQCFAGQVVEVSEGHARIHIDGLPRSEDIWMPVNSKKLFLDGGLWQEHSMGLPELHYWQVMDSKERCTEKHR